MQHFQITTILKVNICIFNLISNLIITLPLHFLKGNCKLALENKHNKVATPEEPSFSEFLATYTRHLCNHKGEKKVLQVTG